MAIGPIVTVLSNIPWGSVIEKAPAIADGAVRLWDSISRKNIKSTENIENEETSKSLNGAGNTIYSLSLRVESLESILVDMRNELLEASTLISDLAQQNTALVARIERNRKILLRQVYAFSAGLVLSLSLLLIYNLHS